MIPDIVIDTNVLMHAGNPDQDYFEDAVSFLTTLQKKSILLCVDEGFDLDEAKNRSLIGGEYLTHLRFGSAGYNVIAVLAASRRIKECSKRVEARTRKKIDQLIRNPRDKTFVRVTCNSVSKILISHDNEDFPVSKRKLLKREIEVQIFTARTGKGCL